MIGRLSGQLVSNNQSGQLILDVHGVGYEIDTTIATALLLNTQHNETVVLFIHMIVREDAQQLYGFIDELDRAMFRILIKITGIGPKLAITMLSNISAQELINCLYQKNILRLTQIPGIGTKTAERLLLEIKDKLTKLNSTQDIKYNQSSGMADLSEAINALINKVDNGNMNCEQLIRHALKYQLRS